MRTKILIMAALVAALAVPALVAAVPVAGLDGRPGFERGGETGAFLWHNRSGYHLRFTTEGTDEVFRGKVCVESHRIWVTKGVRLDAGDSISVTPDGRCAEFEFQNHGYIDGLDFRTRSRKIRVELEWGEGELPAERIWLGAYGYHPPAGSFEIENDFSGKARRAPARRAPAVRRPFN
ncbi:MAG: hypothetical protein R6V85_17220 [Polyangia bacterium]